MKLKPFIESISEKYNKFKKVYAESKRNTAKIILFDMYLKEYIYKLNVIFNVEYDLIDPYFTKELLKYIQSTDTWKSDSQLNQIADSFNKIPFYQKEIKMMMFCSKQVYGRLEKEIAGFANVFDVRRMTAKKGMDTIDRNSSNQV